jgi:hypothetical protein
MKCLDRRRQRTLYLLLTKKARGAEMWVLPTNEVKPKELLHEASHP